ncbi:MAG: gliding motility protein GldM [Flavobacteriales bacterium]|nr:gliding motility protein GldM [Flavobacteriales bacterium]
MAEKKLSPRQKMIGMMYLVLTALLALNVSKEILNAFVLVDSGLARTTDNFNKKNASTYAAFDKAAAEFEKAVEWRNKAYDVKKKSDDLVKLINDLKVAIIQEADKTEETTVEAGHIQAKDNQDIAPQIMLVNGKGEELKSEIESYRKFLTGFIKAKDEHLRTTIESNLSTDDPPPSEHGTETWVTQYFQGLPLIASITMMSKMQNDIRNCEADMINYLLTEIDAGSFKFNKLEAMVLAPTNYVVQGDTFRAQVFVAARDSTQDPDVEVEFAGQDSSKLAQPMKLAVKGGKGVYKVPANSEGFYKWGGVVNIKKPDGSIAPFRFNHSYQVAKPSLVVSADKMNVFYIGVDNPVSISVPGLPPDVLQPSLSSGSISKKGKGYTVRVKSSGTCNVTVFANINGEKKNMGRAEFRVKRVPDPVAKIAGKTGDDKIAKNVLSVQPGLAADMENFDFDLKFIVTAFEMVVTGKGIDPIPKKSDSYALTGDMKKMLRGVVKGNKVYFQNIRAKGPDGSTRKLAPIALEIM